MSGAWGRTALKVFALLAVGILVQTTFGNDLRVDEVAPDFMVLLAVCGGFVGGPDAGAVIGFAAGAMSDLFLQSTPFGLSALAFCLTGFVAGWAKANFLRHRLALVPAVAAAGTVLGVALFVVIGYVVGQAQLVAPGQRWVVQVALVEAVYSAVLALPVAGLMAWALRAPVAAEAQADEVAAVGLGGRGVRRRPRATWGRRRRPARAGVR